MHTGNVEHGCRPVPGAVLDPGPERVDRAVAPSLHPRAMSADPRDDFSLFADCEHMFFGLSEPYALIRHEIETILGRQVPGTDIRSIRGRGEPKFLTLGRKRGEEPDQMIVTHYGVCFQAELEVLAGTYQERLPATMTLLLGDIDRSGEQRVRVSLDLHGDAEAAFDDETFKQRFLAFWTFEPPN